ncbi:MAG: substrate-binding domain-containing protein [Alphaproteobacteria bacterium]|nr:substrate-binding domain-containing protein [Alphaproteobacteria bacterium]MDE2492940.1 substrate-binding domain-containing protein [Alphaproteobacteria bacterium]
MSDIARIAGVHTSTVSRALSGSPLVDETVREKIVNIARSCGYVVNTAARSLRLRRSQTISVVIPLGHESQQPLSDPFFVEMFGYLADEITQRGYGVLLQKFLPPMDRWLETLVASNQPDGILIIGQSTEHKAIETMAKKFLPLVVWGAQAGRQSYCTVGSDNFVGGCLATKHLLACGRRKIVFVGDTHAPEFQLRYRGYKQTLDQGPQGTQKAHVVPSHLTAEQSYAAMRAFVAGKHPFDAIFAATDVIAINAIRAITDAGMSVPGDVAVVGYDDISISAHTNPPLTTVRQNIQEGARTMVDLVFRRIAGEDAASAAIPAELVVRASSKCI